MDNICKLSILCAIVVLLLPMGQKITGNSKQWNTNFSPVTQGDPEAVSYCDLMNNPAKYDGKIIVTEAIEVINLVQVVDGGEPFLFSPMCDKSDSTWVLIDIYESSIDPASNTFKELEKIIVKMKIEKKQPSARVKVRIVGRFFGPKPKGGYGHLDWARFKLVASKIERAEEVQEDTPWPLGYEPAKLSPQ